MNDFLHLNTIDFSLALCVRVCMLKASFAFSIIRIKIRGTKMFHLYIRKQQVNRMIITMKKSSEKWKTSISTDVSLQIPRQVIPENTIRRLLDYTFVSVFFTLLPLPLVINRGNTRSCILLFSTILHWKMFDESNE